MRIDRLDLIAYGPFTNKSLNLSEGDWDLHLIYGDTKPVRVLRARSHCMVVWYSSRN